ncbi:ABC transporter permease [Epidermidibacterium keratini]|uniref:ABC transporter permease n=1 Tax=Epidermidibacterium keratini TaxID=1891644 RepID=A0A7L4YQR6_9ACTN|nr:ABC transporter permease [Epidermidibacterium keratini]QHC01496.1 ABC transporter permease [Epidermidibacterium keratini]
MTGPSQTALIETPTGEAPKRKRSRKSKWLLIAAVFVAFCLVRWATDASQFTSSGSVQAALVLTIPIAMAGLAGLWSERAGIVNIGLEGMLIAGTIFGAWLGVAAGPWVGVLGGILGGALFGLIHAVATVTFGVDQIVSGVAINILAVGVAGLLAELLFPESNGKQSPGPGQITKITLPWNDALNSLQAKGIPVISDLAGIISGMTTSLSLLTIVCLLLFPLTWWILWRTAWGLRVRSAGENPKAAETLGVNVYKMKYLAVILSGAIGGLGGAYLITVSAQGYLENQTGGKGYIGLAAMIFGNWTPSGTLLGSLLFGYSTAVNQRSDLSASTAIVVLAAIGLAVLLVLELRKLATRRGEVAVKRSSQRTTVIFTCALVAVSLVSLVFAGINLLSQGQFIPDSPENTTLGKVGVIVLVGVVMVLFAGIAYYGVQAIRATVAHAQTSANLPAYVAGYALFAWMWLSGTGIPQSFKSAIPNIITLLVLTFASQRLRMPAADGLVYRRGE